MSSIALNTGQSPFHYGPALPFEEKLFIDALNPDSDGDSITDGQEINGYELTWMEPSKDGPIQHGPTTYTSDPLDPHNADASGKWRDIDGDGISDYNETHYGEAYDWLVSWAKQKSDDYNKSDKSGEEFNYTEYINNQFNPFVKENTPPMITDITIDTDVATHTQLSWPPLVVDHCWAVVTVEVFDVAPFTMTITAGDHGSSMTFDFSEGKHEQTATLNIDYWTDYLVDYKVNVTSTDAAGNTVYFDKKINGVFGGVLDALADIWDAVVGAFAAAAKAAGEAVNWFIDWVLEQINKIMNEVLEPIKNAIANWLQNIANTLSAGLDEFKDARASGDSFDANATASAVLTQLFGDFFELLMVFSIALVVIFTVVTPYLTAFGFLLGMVMGIIMDQLKGMMGIEETGDVGGDNQGSSFTMAVIIEMWKSYMWGEKKNSDTITLMSVVGTTQNINNEDNTYNYLLSLIVGMTALSLGAISLPKPFPAIPPTSINEIGELAGIIGFALSAISLILYGASIFGLLLTEKQQSLLEAVSLFLALWALVLSVVGIIFGVGNMRIVAAIGVVLSGISLYYGLKQMGLWI